MNQSIDPHFINLSITYTVAAANTDVQREPARDPRALL